MQDTNDAFRHAIAPQPQQWLNTILTGVDADLSCYVLIIDSQCSIVFMNSAASHWIGPHEMGEGGRCMLSDVFPRNIARERQGHVQDVLNSGEPMIVDGIIHGEGLRCIMRRMPMDDAHRHAVLMIFRPLDRVMENDSEPTPILAKSNDLGALARLTPRETEVLTYIAQGLSSDEVAFRLRRSRRTIDCHRAAISHKLDAHSVADLAVLAHRAGLVRCAATNGDGGAHFKSITAPELLECIVNPKRQRIGLRNA